MNLPFNLYKVSVWEAKASKNANQSFNVDMPSQTQGWWGQIDSQVRWSRLWSLKLVAHNLLWTGYTKEAAWRPGTAYSWSLCGYVLPTLKQGSLG